MKRVVAIVLGLCSRCVSRRTLSFSRARSSASLVGPNGVVDCHAPTSRCSISSATPSTTVTAINGEFRMTNVAIGSYSLRAEAPPFEAVVQTLTVADALPITLELKLSAALAEQVNVTAENESARHDHDADHARRRCRAARADSHQQPRTAGCDCDDARMGDRRQRPAARARRGRRVSVCRRRRADVRADGQRCTASRPIRKWSSRSTSSSAMCRPSSASSRAASSR